MYKIMIADDEGIVIDALKYIIEHNFPSSCMIESAKTGRQVIELAERFRPDIAFMDIQMPGINGITAMQEIRRNNKNIIFIIISAYGKFHYAKEAINLGVLEYMSKPIVQQNVVDVLNRAAGIVDENCKKRENELMIQEKLETVLPIIESGMIYSIFFEDNYGEEQDNYCKLLGITQKQGYVIVIRFGDAVNGGKLTNTIGISVKGQTFYQEMREVVKEYTQGIVGSMMGNSVVVFVPTEEIEAEYNTRIQIIERMREMARILQQHMDAQFRIGIGAVKKLKKLSESYSEALEALRISQGTVAHVNDLPIGCRYEKDYPADTEKKIFDAVENGDRIIAKESADAFFTWMLQVESVSNEDIKLKVLEFTMWAERIAYESGGMIYRMSSRHTYLNEVLQVANMEELRNWFLVKIIQACENVKARKKESAHEVIDHAKHYIEEHYRDVSLDDISREVNISPYYFSKLFKEKTGDNFIDYITEIKISNAKEMILDNKKSMKVICRDIGYANPNYFSYIFKKKVGVTPSEYREGLS